MGETPPVAESEKRKTAHRVGFPAAAKLDEFGSVVWAAFGHPPMLVGSALRTRDWRDIDVRLILTDEEYEREVGQLTMPQCANERWNALCLAFSALGCEMTGLPIDFQIQQMTDANAKHDGNRLAVGLFAPGRFKADPGDERRTER